MRHRFTTVVLGAALFMLLAGTATVAASTKHATASSYNVGIVYSRTGLSPRTARSTSRASSTESSTRPRERAW